MDIKDKNEEDEYKEIVDKPDYVMNFIAMIVVVGYFIMCLTVAFTKLDQSDHDVLYMMIGQLTAGFIMVLGYYFGSSKTNPKRNND